MDLSPDPETMSFLEMDTALTAARCGPSTNWGAKSGNKYVLTVRSVWRYISHRQVLCPFGPEFFYLWNKTPAARRQISRIERYLHGHR